MASRLSFAAALGLIIGSLLLVYLHRENSSKGRNELRVVREAEKLRRGLARKPQVIKGRGASIWVVEGGYKHLIPDWDTYTDLGFDANDVRLVSQEELGRIPDGAPVKPIGDRERINTKNICPCESISRQPFAIKANITVAPHKICIIANKASDTLFTEYYDPTYLMKHLQVRFVSEKAFKHHEEVARWNMYDKAALEDGYNTSLYESAGVMNLDAMRYASSVTGIEYVDDPTAAPTPEPGKEPPPPLSKMEGKEDERHPHKPRTEDGSYDSDKDPYPSQYFFNANEDDNTRRDQCESGKACWSHAGDWNRDEGKKEANSKEKARRRLEMKRSVAAANSNADSGDFSCDVTLEIMGDDVELRSHVCPGICMPHPRAIVPLDLLRPVPQNPGQDLTCSMRLDSIFPSSSSSSSSSDHEKKRGLAADTEKSEGPDKAHARLAILLQAISRRKIEECLEKEYWTAGRRGGLNKATLIHHPGHSTNPPKRKVRGLIIWIGSLSRFDLARAQIEVLKSQAATVDAKAPGESATQQSEDQIVGWLATEEVYPCRKGTTLCDEVSSHGSYYQDMPGTRLNMASAGYSCAQRRPLRSLAHTLRLFDPTDFVMVVDDDTFVNIDLLKPDAPLSKYIATVMRENHFVMGELTEGKKITTKGFFYGGAGYVMGRAVLDRLVGHRVMGPPEWSSVHINAIQMTNLQMLTQTIKLSNHSCPKDPASGQDTCLVDLHGEWVNHDPTGNSFGYGWDVYATLNDDTMMVDVCMNIMSEEHSCYHSDHALSRCLTHGVYALAVDQWCGGSGFKPPALPMGPTRANEEGPRVGMCMNIDDKCESESGVHFTCHHWMPDKKNYRKAVPANKALSYEK